MYDVRKLCVRSGLCYDTSAIATFLARPATRRALGVPRAFPGEWQECNAKVQQAMRDEYMVSAAPLIPAMLRRGVRLLVYNGDQDLICNFLGELYLL